MNPVSVSRISPMSLACADEMLFAAVNESESGTKRTWRDARLESVLRSEADFGQQPDAPSYRRVRRTFFDWFDGACSRFIDWMLAFSARALPDFASCHRALGWGVVNSLELILAGPVGLLHTQKVG